MTRRIRVHKREVTVTETTEASPVVVGVDTAKGDSITAVAQVQVAESGEVQNVRPTIAINPAANIAEAMRGVGASAADALRILGAVTGRVSSAAPSFANTPRASDGGLVRDEEYRPRRGGLDPFAEAYERRVMSEVTDATYRYRIEYHEDIRTRDHLLLMVIYRGGSRWYNSESRIRFEEVIADGPEIAISRAIDELAHGFMLQIREDMARRLAMGGTLNSFMERYRGSLGV